MNIGIAGLDAAAALAAIGLAPVAHSDPRDAYFVQGLASNGTHIPDPPSRVGNVGRQICALLGYDWTIGTASYSAMAEYPDLSESQARTFVHLSQQTYCPG